MAIFDPTSTIGGLVVSLANNVTGSLFLALLFLTFVFVAVCMAFRLPMELTVPIILPFLLISYLITANFLPILGVALIYLAVLFVKTLWLR